MGSDTAKYGFHDKNFYSSGRRAPKVVILAVLRFKQMLKLNFLASITNYIVLPELQALNYVLVLLGVRFNTEKLVDVQISAFYIS